MTYYWREATQTQPLTQEWFDDQDRRSEALHHHFSTRSVPFDRLIPYQSLAGKEVLEIGVGSGFHAELLARAGAAVTGIDLTEAAIAATSRRFQLKGLNGSFQTWDAERHRADFSRRFSYVWSWGVIHHSARTGRIVRNVAHWLSNDGRFAGMVYHRDSTAFAVALIRDWFFRGKAVSQSLDETLWRNSDGFSARFYPADQWRDLLLAFYAEADTCIAGTDVDLLPLPSTIRMFLWPRVSDEFKRRVGGRAGRFIVFDARRPLRGDEE